MSDSYTPQDATEDVKHMAEETTENMEDAANRAASTFESGLPEGMRAMAEKAVAQTREGYEMAKGNMEETVHAWEKSFDAYGQGASAFQQKLLDIFQSNMNSGFDFAKKLTEAKDFSEVAKMQQAFMQKQLSTLSDQAGELRALSTKVAEDASQPIKSQFSKSFEKMPGA
ncbi:phasin family protein [Methyloligella solikamskensis]|uniref:Phasin family protein n=1 Tax=Methyloligella solikamskensis TaxID=1177756 RepID=A0ABW3JDW1_9HYPH